MAIGARTWCATSRRRPAARCAGVCDMDPQRLAARASGATPACAPAHPALTWSTTPQVDAVAIATPVSSHFELAMAALKAGKHVLVEKPMTETAEQAARLVEEADRRATSCSWSTTPSSTPAPCARCGEIIDARRTRRPLLLRLRAREFGSVPARRERDLGPGGSRLARSWTICCTEHPVSGVRRRHRPLPGVHRRTWPTSPCFYEPALIAHVSVNWLAPVKMRQTLIGGSRR